MFMHETFLLLTYLKYLISKSIFVALLTAA